MTNKLLYQIAISLIPGIGNAIAKNLIAYTGDVEEVFHQTEKMLQKIPGIGTILASQIASQDVIERAKEEVHFIEKHNIEPLFFLNDKYPARLKECNDAPILIYTKGNISFERSKVISIVGTRNATDYGRYITNNLIQELSYKHKDALIVSGLAYGIDIEAHKAALKYGLETIGVLGHGLDRIYPSVHRKYAKQMLERGGLVTEFISDSQPDRKNFVKRNRIVAGIADATIVVESASKGGSLITADIAYSYNRDVFAFPGRVNEEQSMGCNMLIKNNRAALLEDANDLERYMNWEPKQNNTPIQKSLFVDLSTDESTLIEILKTEKSCGMNLLALQSAMPISKVASNLLSLEFKGMVKSIPGNMFQLA